jgi:adenine-specific DNA-methyltransferase
MTKRIIHDVELDRLALQSMLDEKKTQLARNKLGQFSTPTALARDILKYAADQLPTGSIQFLDPAIGTGAFYSALKSEFPDDRIAEAKGYEIDPCYGSPTAKLWSEFGLDYEMGDFTKALPNSRYNLIICNPPYVRHHHITNEDKLNLQRLSTDITGRKFSGLAGLYCYFLAIADAWMVDDGIAGWLIPSEFMDVNYGQELKRYLLEDVTLLHIHRFDPNDVQFADALVSSAVVWFRKSAPPANHAVKFSFGGILSEPKIIRDIQANDLMKEAKWTRFPLDNVRTKSNIPTLSDFFKIKRGVATGDNGYFIMTEEEMRRRGFPQSFFRPILPSPRYVKADEIEADAQGLPALERRLFLLDPQFSEEEIGKNYPNLFSYLLEGRAKGVHERYLCSRRRPWYTQEKREPSPIICTYLGRGDTKNGKPFRFILNNSRAIVANVYLSMYPTPALASALANDSQLIRRVWEALNRIDPSQLLGEGRVYGGGLHKLEPRELANVPVAELADILDHVELASVQNELFPILEVAE